MGDRERRRSGRSHRDRRQRHLGPVGGGGVEPLERGRVGREARLDLVDDAVLVAPGVDDGDLALGEGAVERGADIFDADAEAGRRLAVDGHVDLEPGLLAVGADVDDAGHRAQPLQHLRAEV